MHGNVIPVIDLASLTGDEISHLSKSNILAIRKNDIAVAVLIDGLPEAVTETEVVKISDIGDLPAELNNYMNEGISSKSVVWIELNIYGLLKELALLHAETDNK
jgi:chemotaxis signal transduction protein